MGTLMLAVLAARCGAFYVAAPCSTVDLRTPAGAQIPVEERDAAEVTHIAGKRGAAEGIHVFAPAFDVTPAELITAIVTDLGVARPPFGDSLAALLREPSGRAGKGR